MAAVALGPLLHFAARYRALSAAVATLARGIDSSAHWTFRGLSPDSDAEVIELDPAGINEAESERYELYREIWCKEFRDIRSDDAVVAAAKLSGNLLQP